MTEHEVFDNETGEVLEPITRAEHVRELIFKMMKGTIKPYEANGLLLGAKLYFSQHSVEIEDAMFRREIEELDFTEESKYWKSTFEMKKLRTKLRSEDPDYDELYKQHEQLSLAKGLIDMAESTIKMVNWSPWGTRHNKPRDDE